MQIDSLSNYYDTMPLSVEHPLSPEGYLFTYYPDETPAALHYHDFLEIGYCEQGSGIFLVDGEVIPFSGECVSIIYGKQSHIAKSISPEKSLWHFLYVDMEKLFYPVRGNMNPMAFPGTEEGMAPSVIHRQEDEDLYCLVRMLLKEAALCREDYLSAVRGLVHTILVTHARYRTEELLNPSAEKNHLLAELEELLTYIGTHYTERISIAELCAVAGMSKSTMQRKMIQCVGCAPLQYIHHLRLNHALVLLKDRSIPISEVAIRSGFSTLSSFNRSFQQSYRESPSAWRKRQ